MLLHGDVAGLVCAAETSLSLSAPPFPRPGWVEGPNHSGIFIYTYIQVCCSSKHQLGIMVETSGSMQSNSQDLKLCKSDYATSEENIVASDGVVTFEQDALQHPGAVWCCPRSALTTCLADSAPSMTCGSGLGCPQSWGHRPL